MSVTEPMTLAETVLPVVALKFNEPGQTIGSPESLDLSEPYETAFTDENPFNDDSRVIEPPKEPESREMEGQDAEEEKEIPITQKSEIFSDPFPIREEPDGSEGEDTKAEQTFDDFCDFRSGPDILSEKWTEPPQWTEPVAVTFETNFDATFPDADDQMAKHVIAESQVISQDDEDDDDFGDFNEAPTTTFQTSDDTQLPLPQLNLEQFVETLGMMFPNVPIDSESDADSNAKEKIIMRDIESSEALKYKYGNSTSNITLMDSIGIDSKNVLFGMKWNSSMPRFAANLSFDPIQPLKPTKPTDVASGSKDVPVAQFDWTTAGLVNPLDGKFTKFHDLYALCHIFCCFLFASESRGKLIQLHYVSHRGN